MPTRAVRSYALLPHTGELAVSNVMHEAAVLNRAPIAAPGVAVQVQAPFQVLSGTSTLEVLKKAEKSDDLVIRFVETRGGADRIVLKTNLENVKLVETNLVEWTSEAEYEFDGGNCLELAFKPFELRTFKVVKK